MYFQQIGSAQAPYITTIITPKFDFEFAKVFVIEFSRTPQTISTQTRAVNISHLSAVIIAKIGFVNLGL